MEFHAGEKWKLEGPDGVISIDEVDAKGVYHFTYLESGKTAKKSRKWLAKNVEEDVTATYQPRLESVRAEEPAKTVEFSGVSSGDVDLLVQQQIAEAEKEAEAREKEEANSPLARQRALDEDIAKMFAREQRIKQEEEQKAIQRRLNARRKADEDAQQRANAVAQAEAIEQRARHQAEVQEHARLAHMQAMARAAWHHVRDHEDDREADLIDARLVAIATKQAADQQARAEHARDIWHNVRKHTDENANSGGQTVVSFSHALTLSTVLSQSNGTELFVRSLTISKPSPPRKRKGFRPRPKTPQKMRPTRSRQQIW